jgi:hypothetical protein
MKATLAVVAVLLVGCGPEAPEFDGQYMGAMVTTGTCDDGGRINTSEAVRIAVKSQAGSLLINDGSSCADYTAAVSGSSAVFNPKLCPDETASNGNVAHLKATGGTVSLSGDVLAVALEQAVSVYSSLGAHVRECTGTASGNLQRQ